MALMTLPGRFPGRLGRASTLLLNLLPDGKIAAAETGQALTFARATVGGYVTDTLGRVRSTIHSQPKYEAVDLDGDGIRETLGLLLEPQRTNVMLRSEEFDNAAWTKTRTSVTANATRAPDGVASMDKLLETAVTNTFVVEQATGALTASTYSALSVFLKAAERSWAYLELVRKDGTSGRVWFDLANGVVGTVGANCRGRIERYGDGIYRCLAGFDSLTGATTTVARIGIASADNVSSYAGSATSGLYAWGAQFEVDAPFPTSYVPTTTAAVTKSADALSCVAAWPVQDITVYAKVARPWWTDLNTLPTTNFGLLRWGSSTSHTLVYLHQPGSTVWAKVVDSAGVAQETSVAIPAGNVIEVCVQVADVRTAVRARVDVGVGFGAYTTPAGPWSPDTTATPGSNNNIDQVSAPLLALKVAAGARTMDQMRGAY